MRGLKWFLGVLVALATIGALYQIVGMMLDRKQHPPIGRLIDIGGHRLHLYCMGQGSPTVVLEAAAPGWSLYWSTVQPEVARMTRVCAYERAGLGWSERGPLPRTGRRLAHELHQLLTRAGVPGPYILVVHSLGGFITRLYREEHPRDIVGMVLVDAGHVSEMRQAEFRSFANAGKSMLPVIRAMTILGIPRLMAPYDQLPPLLTGQEEKVPGAAAGLARGGGGPRRGAVAAVPGGRAAGDRSGAGAGRRVVGPVGARRRHDARARGRREGVHAGAAAARRGAWRRPTRGGRR